MKRALALLVVVALTSLAAVCDARSSSANPRRTPVVKVVEAARPAVVNIHTETLIKTPFRRYGPFSGDPTLDEFFSRFFDPRYLGGRTEKRTSLGSGVLVNADGTIVTNEHVIVRASTIRVMMADKSEFIATLIGADSDSDLAVLKVEARHPLPYIDMPEDNDVMIGESVVAIGNPYGLSHTVTVGVVSAVGRTIEAGERVYHDFIQTDASINPGNSGGPLISLDGKLLGINSAIHRSAEGIGFAIPAIRVRRIVEQLITFGTVKPPWIGIQIQGLTPELAFHFGVESNGGVLINGIEEGSPAEKAGLTAGAIIERVENEKVRSPSEFAEMTAGLSVGEKLHLDVRTQGKSARVVIKVATLPDERIDALAWRRLGIEVVDNPRSAGVVVRRVRSDSPADRIGMRAGDGIAAIGGSDIAALADFRRRFAAFRNSNNVLLTVVRGRRLYRVTLPLDNRF